MHEARLLDEAQFDEWLALFTDEAHGTGCRASPNQAKPARHRVADV